METTIERIERKMNQVFAQIEKNDKEHKKSDREYKRMAQMLYDELLRKTKIINNLQKKHGKITTNELK